MKILQIVALMLFPVLCFSQRLHLNLFGGFSNYQGDLQSKPFTLDQSNGSLGAGLSYDLTDHFSLRSGLMYGRVEASDDQNKPSLQVRNLSFKSKVLEGNLLLEYKLLSLQANRFTPYAFAGLGVFRYNPYTYDTLNNKTYLHPLSTEGQGLAAYPDRKMYKLTQFALPFGGGFKLRVNDNVVLGYEIGLRKTFTDYLDDVSSSYVDQSMLAAAKGPKAVELAYRGGELKNGDPGYPVAGSKRGSPNQKDWYYFQGVTLSIGLNGKMDGGSRPRRNNMGCPVQVL